MIKKPVVFRRQVIRVRSMDSKTAGYPRFRLFTPNPPDFFLMGCSLTKKKQAGPTRLFFGIQAVKTSEFIERTLKLRPFLTSKIYEKCRPKTSEKPLKNLRGPRTFQEPLGGFPEVFQRFLILGFRSTFFVYFRCYGAHGFGFSS